MGPAAPPSSSVHAEWRSFVSSGTLVSGGVGTLAFSLLWGWPVCLYVVLLLYAHEFGHVITARWRGVAVQGSPMFLPGFGAYVVIAPDSGPWDQVLISLAGPTVGASVALTAMVVGLHIGSASVVFAAKWGLVVNLFNLAPFAPLDGGRVVSKTGWVGFFFTLLMGGLFLFALKLSDWFVLLLVAFGIDQALRAVREKSRPAGAARLGILCLYAGIVIALLLAVGFGERWTSLRGVRVNESDFPPSNAVWVKGVLGFAVGAYLLSLVALPYAWRKGRRAPTRYLVCSLLCWPQYLLTRPWMIAVTSCLAAETLGAPGALWLENLVRASSKRRGPIVSAGCAFGYDCMTWLSREHAMTWLRNMIPVLKSGGQGVLLPTYSYLLLLGHWNAYQWLARASGMIEPTSPSQAVTNSAVWGPLEVEHAPIALPVAKAAVQAEPSNPYYLETLGNLYLTLGSAVEAERSLRRSLGQRDEISTRLSLARAIAAQGRQTEAISEVEQVLSQGTESWPKNAPSPDSARAWLDAWTGRPRMRAREEVASPRTARKVALAQRYEIPIFCILVLALSWLVLGSAIAQRRGLLAFHLPILFAYFEITLVAFLVAGVFEGRPAVRDLLRRMVRWRVGVQWYAIVVLLGLGPPLVAAGVHRLFGGNVPLGRVSFQGTFAYFVVITILMLLTEETGWRGFALPRLEVKYRALTASLIVGLLWSVWLTPRFLMPDALQVTSHYLGLVLVTMAESVLMTWVYNSTGGSVLLTSILHAAENSAEVYMGIGSRDVSVFWVYAGVWCVAAAIVVAREGPDRLSRSRRADYSSI